MSHTGLPTKDEIFLYLVFLVGQYCHVSVLGDLVNYENTQLNGEITTQA